VLARVASDDVSDIVQDVFTSALDRLATLVEAKPFGPWISAIARNRAIDHLRLRRSSVSWRDDLRASSPGAHEALDALRMILSLPETYRETMVLRLVEGMRGPEIAERTGLTPGSVRVKLCRGMKLLRRKLGEAKR